MRRSSTNASAISRNAVAGILPCLAALARNLVCTLTVTRVVKYAIFLCGVMMIKFNVDVLYRSTIVIRLLDILKNF